MRQAIINAFAVTLMTCAAITTPAQTASAPREDVQFWNETQLIIPMNERVDLIMIGVLRIGRSLTHPIDEREARPSHSSPTNS